MGSLLSDLSNADQSIFSHKIFNLSLHQINYYHQRFRSFSEDFWIDQEMFLNIFNEFEEAFAFWDYNLNSLINCLDVFSTIVIFSQSTFEEQLDQQLIIFDLNESLIFSSNDIEFMIQTTLNSIVNVLSISVNDLQEQVYKFVSSIFRDDINYNCTQIYNLLINNDLVHLLYFSLHQLLLFTRQLDNESGNNKQISINEVIKKENNIDDKLSHYRTMNNYKNTMETTVINKNQTEWVQIQTSWIYGFNCTTSKQIFAVYFKTNLSNSNRNKDTLMYSVGKIIIILSESKAKQHYFTEHSSDVTTFCLSENREMCASCEILETALILIWNIDTLRVSRKIKTEMQSPVTNIFFYNKDLNLIYSSIAKRTMIEIYSLTLAGKVILYSCKELVREIVPKISKIHCPLFKIETSHYFCFNFESEIKLFSVNSSDNSYNLTTIFGNKKYTKITNVLFLESRSIEQDNNIYNVFIGADNLFFIIIQSDDLEKWKTKFCISIKFSISKISMYYNHVLILLSNSVIQIFDYNELCVLSEYNLQQLGVIFKSTSVHQLYTVSNNTYFMIIKNGDVIKMTIKTLKNQNYKKQFKVKLRIVNEIIYIDSEISNINIFDEGIGERKLILTQKSKPALQIISLDRNLLYEKMSVREITMCLDSYYNEDDDFNLVCMGMFGGEILFYLNSIQIQSQAGFKEFSQPQIIKFVKKCKWVICSSTTKYLIVYEQNKENFKKIENYLDLTTQESMYDSKWCLNVPKDEVIISINECIDEGRCVLQTFTNKFYQFSPKTGTFNLLFDISSINTKFNIFKMCSKSKSIRNNDFIQNQFVIQDINNGVVIISGVRGEVLVYPNFEAFKSNNYLIYKVHLSSIENVVYNPKLSKIYTIGKSDRMILESQLTTRKAKASILNTKNKEICSFLEKKRNWVDFHEIRHLYIDDPIIYLLNFQYKDLVSMLVSNGKKMSNQTNPLVPGNSINLIKVLNVSTALYNTNYKYLKRKTVDAADEVNKPIIDMDYKSISIRESNMVKSSNINASYNFKRKTFKTEFLPSRNLNLNSRIKNIGKSDVSEPTNSIRSAIKDNKHSFFKTVMKSVDFNRYLIYSVERFVVVSPAEDLSIQYLFQTHEKEITCIEVSNSGSFVATVDKKSNPMILIWSPRSFQVLKEIQTFHSHSVLYLKISDDESKLLTISSDSDWYIQLSSSTDEPIEIYKKGINDKIISILFNHHNRFFILTVNYIVKYEFLNLELVTTTYCINRSEFEESCPVNFFFLEKEQINAIVFYRNGDVRLMNTDTCTLYFIIKIDYEILSVESFNFDFDLFYSIVTSQNDLIIFSNRFRILCSMNISNYETSIEFNFILNQDINLDVKTNEAFIIINHYNGSVVEIGISYSKDNPDIISMINKREVVKLESNDSKVKCIDIHPSLMLMILCTGDQNLLFYEPVELQLISKVNIGYRIHRCYFSLNEKLIILLTEESRFIFMSTSTFKSNGIKISGIDKKILKSMIVDDSLLQKIVFEISFSYNNDLMAVSYICLDDKDNKKIGSVNIYSFFEEMENNILKRKFKLNYELKPSSKSFNKLDLYSNYLVCTKCQFTEDCGLLITNYQKVDIVNKSKWNLKEKIGTLIYFDLFKKIEKTMNPINKDLKLNPLYFSEALKANKSFGPLSYSPILTNNKNKISDLIQDSELRFSSCINYLGYSILGDQQGSFYICNQINLNENSFQDDRFIQIKKILAHSGNIFQIKSLRNTGVILSIKENGQGVMQWKLSANDSSNNLDGNDMIQKNDKVIINNIEPKDIWSYIRKDFMGRKHILDLENLDKSNSKLKVILKIVKIFGFSSSNFCNNIFTNSKSHLFYISGFNIVKIKNPIRNLNMSKSKSRNSGICQLLDDLVNQSNYINDTPSKEDPKSMFSNYVIDFIEKNRYSISVMVMNYNYSKLVIAIKNNPLKICVYNVNFKILISELSIENIEVVYKMSISNDDMRLVCLCLNNKNQPEVYFICLVKNIILSFTSLKYNSIKKLNSIDFFYELNDKFITVGANNCTIWNYKTNCLEFNELTLKAPESKKGITDIMDSEQRMDLNNLFFTVVKSFSSSGFIIADYRGHVCLINRSKVTNIKKTFGDVISVVEFLKKDRSVFAVAGKSHEIFIFKICMKFPESYHLENTLTINLKSIFVQQGMEYGLLNQNEFIIQSLRSIKKDNLFVGVNKGNIYNLGIEQNKLINTNCDCQINSGPLTSEKTTLAINKSCFDFQITKIFENFDNETPDVILYLSKYQMYVIGCRSGLIYAFDYNNFVIVFIFKMEEGIKSMILVGNDLVISTNSLLYFIEDKIISGVYLEYLKNLKENEFYDYKEVMIIPENLVNVKVKVLKLIASKFQKYVVMFVEVDSKTFIEIYSARSFFDILFQSVERGTCYLKSLEITNVLFVDFSDNENHFCIMTKEGHRQNFMINKDNLSEISIQQNNNIQWQHNGFLSTRNILTLLKIFNKQNYIISIDKIENNLYVLNDNLGCVK